MKTKKSRRLLAAFLAAIMVLTTFAAMPFSSYAAEHSAEELKNLIDQVETRLEGGTPYTNLVNTYEAWYDANLTYFLVTAGVRDADEVDNAYNNLNTQFTAMQRWTPAQATANAAADGSYTAAGLVDNDQMSGVLYAEGVGADTDFADVRTDDGGAGTETRAGVQYGTTVLMYDGTGTPLAFPVSMYTARYTLLANSGTRSMRPTTEPFGLVKNWHGFSNTVGYQTGVASFVGYQDNSDFLSHLNASNDSPDRYSNTLYWNGNADTFGDEYMIHYPSQDWITYNDDRNSGTFTQNANIYVINYSALVDALGNMPTNLCDYSYTLVRSYLRTLDTAMGIAPQSYFASANEATVADQVDTCVTAIDNAISSIATTRRALTTTVNMQSYFTFASNFAAYTPIYESKNKDEYYTSTSYSLFVRNYEIANSAINNLANKSVRFTDATTNNTNLVNAYNNLVTSEAYIDDSELQTYFAAYYGLTQGYYTAESYQAATEAINAALEHYNNGSYTSGITLRQNEEDEATYNTILANVKEAMAGLRISHDAVVSVLSTQQSYNTIVAYVQGIDGYKYSNYTDVMDIVAEATRTMTELDNTAFTDQATLVSQYTTLITNIANALLELQTAFTGTEDGSVVNSTTGTTEAQGADDIYSYLYNQITNITYLKTQPGTTSYVTEYDITFNNHWNSWFSNREAQLHSLGFGAYGQDSISDSNGTMSVRWKEGSAAWVSPASASYHDALMKQPSSVSSGNDYVNLPAATDGTVVLGETTVTVGDLGMRAVSFTTPDIHEYLGVEAGGWDGFQTRDRTNTNLHQTVTVVDISDLIELVQQAADIVGQYQNNAFNCYTPQSWATFNDALGAAQADLNYTSMTADQIISEAQSRYNTLQTAMTGLQQNTEEGSHNLIEQADSTHATCTAGGTAHYICSVCGYDVKTPESALGHEYIYTPDNNGTTHTKTCSRGDVNETEACVDENSDLHCDLCGQALYTPANWEAFNAAKAEMESLLSASAGGSMKFTSAALEDANFNIIEIRYYNYTAEDQATVADTLQDAIDQQTRMINAAVTALRNGLADESVYEANQFKVSTLNADAYNVAAVQSAVSGINVETPVEVNGNVYTGYDYDNYNMALGTALTENWIPYTILVMDQAGNEYWVVDDGDGTFSYTDTERNASEFHYGDSVTVQNPDGSDERCAWISYVYTDNLEPGVNNKYQYFGSEYTFNVRGYTEISTTSGAEADTTLQKVTFFLSLDGVPTNKVIDVQYAKNGATIRANNLNLYYNLPFYEVDTFYNRADMSVLGKGSRAQIKVNGDMNVLVDFTTVSPTDYTITLVDEEGSQLDMQHASYNELVTLSADDAVAYLNNANGKALCYGSEYSFYACQDITVKAVKSVDEQTASVDMASPIIDSDAGKVYLVGSFALPEGVTIQSFGFVLNGLDSNDTDLSLADISAGNQIYNLSASKYTNEGQNGNQFTVSFNSNRMYPRGTVVAYAIYVDNAGNQYYTYSDVITDAALQ